MYPKVFSSSQKGTGEIGQKIDRFRTIPLKTFAPTLHYGMKPTVLTASNEVMDVLRRSTVDDEGLVLPGQLDRKDYVNVNKFLETSGAK